MNWMNKNLVLKLATLLAGFAFFAGTSQLAMASITSPENGKEYTALAQPQPTESKDKVEVTEFFFYTCPHCNLLDPYISAWAKKQGSAISFKRVPVDFGQGQTALTKLYYTLEALGKLDALHSKIFEAIHVKRQPMSTDQQVVNFVTANGVDKKQFEDMSNSFGVASKIRRAKTLQSSYNIDSVPMVFVDGRYMTSPALIMGSNPKFTEAQSEEGMMKVLDALVLKAQKEKQGAAATTTAPKADTKAEPKSKK